MMNEIGHNIKNNEVIILSHLKYYKQNEKIQRSIMIIKKNMKRFHSK